MVALEMMVTLNLKIFGAHDLYIRELKYTLPREPKRAELPRVVVPM